MVHIHNHVVLCLFFLLYICTSYTLCADNTETDSTRIYRLQEVVFKSRVLTKDIFPVQSLSGEKLEKLNAHSVADAIRYFSGVQIKDYGGIGGLKTVNIRSMGSNHVGVFYDGIELGNAQNGVIDLGRFSLDNMEAISLYNGQKSNIFQPAKDYGSSGSVYLQSKIPFFDTDRKHNIKATFKTGSFGLANPSILWEQKLNKNISSSVSAEYMYTTGRYKFRYKKANGYDTTAIRHNGDVRALRAEIGLFGLIPDGNWRTRIYTYNSERGYPGAVVKNRFSNEDRQWDTNFFLQSSFRKKFNALYSLLLNGKFAYDYLHYLSDQRETESLNNIDNRYKQQEGYISAANQFTIFPFWTTNISVDFLWNRLDADLIDFAYPRRFSTLAAFATALDFNKIKLQASILGTFIKEKAKTKENTAHHKPQYTPTIMVYYRPWEKGGVNFRAFYKKIFRLPTLNDLYYTTIGNIHLDPEYTTQYNIGITFEKNFPSLSFKHVEIQTDAYYNRVNNKIVAIPANNPFRWMMLNLGTVKIKGVDVALQGSWLFGKSWQLNTRINYTYQKAQDFTDPKDTYYKGQIPYIPIHSGTAVVGTEYKDWNINYSFIYTGERYDSRANIPANYIQPWYTSDLSISKKLNLKGIQSKIMIEVNNLFNQQYEVVRSYPMPGTNFRITLSVTL